MNRWGQGGRENRQLRILLADDHAIVREGLRALIGGHRGFDICGEASDGRSTVDLAAAVNPDIVILDVSMPDLNGIEAARQILQQNNEARVIILTMHSSEDLLDQAIALGVHGYVLKSDADELVAAISAVAAGQFFWSSGLVGYIPTVRCGDRKSSARKDRLTPREREIVQLLAEGKTSKEIADVLSLAVKTVETHRTNILRKLDCHSIAEVVLYAVRNKIVEP
jgi:DNA-binding NarL/FixJ family response regulator